MWKLVCPKCGDEVTLPEPPSGPLFCAVCKHVLRRAPPAEGEPGGPAQAPRADPPSKEPPPAWKAKRKAEPESVSWNGFARGCSLVRMGLWVELIALGFALLLLVLVQTGGGRPAIRVTQVCFGLVIYLGGFIVVLGRWYQQADVPPKGDSVSGSFVAAAVLEAGRFLTLLVAGFAISGSAPPAFREAFAGLFMVSVLLRLLVDLATLTNMAVVSGLMANPVFAGRVASLSRRVQLIGGAHLLVRIGR